MTDRDSYHVSIVIPTYRATSSLVNTINSVLDNSTLAIQIVVIEDGSTAPSKGILEEHFSQYLDDTARHHIDYVYQENSGGYHARIAALDYCEGSYIKFLDQDDLLLSDELTKEEAAFDGSTDVVLSNWYVGAIEDADNIDQLRSMQAPNYSEPIDDFLTVGGVFTSAALYRSEFLKRVLKPVSGFTPTKADDWMIFAQVCISGARYKTIDNYAYIWTQSDDQLSRFSRNKLVYDHYNILSWIENELLSTGRLTEKRRRLLANYYAKQLIEASEQDSELFMKMVASVERLDPHYKMQYGNKLYRSLTNLFGIRTGLSMYVRLKKLLGKEKLHVDTHL